METASNPRTGWLAGFTVRQRKRLWRSGVVLALAVPHSAHPYGLQQLLHMPLEQLLQLQVSPLRASHPGAGHEEGGRSGADRKLHAV